MKHEALRSLSATAELLLSVFVCTGALVVTDRHAMLWCLISNVLLFIICT